MRGSVRAVLSNRYRILDNFDVAAKVIPIVERVLGVSWRDAVRSCAVTESKMYIKIVHPNMEAKIPIPEGLKMGVGHNFFVDKVQAGIKLENSEIGLGRFVLSPAVFTERCTNYATFESSKFARVHLGKKIGEGIDVAEIFSDQTKALDDAAVLSKIADVTEAALDGRIFEKQVKQLTDARADLIPEIVNPVKVVEVVADQNGLTETEADAVLKPCPKILSEMFFFTDGRAVLCCWDVEGRVVIGDVNLNTVLDIWNGPVAGNYRELLSRGERKKIWLCSRCDAYKHLVWTPPNVGDD